MVRLVWLLALLGSVQLSEALPQRMARDSGDEVSLRAAARVYRQARPVIADGMMTWRAAAPEVVFRAGSRAATVDGVQVFLHRGIQPGRWSWFMADVDARVILDPLMRPNAHLRPVRAGRILLDPGHGGDDRGAVNHLGMSEKALNLWVAQRVRQRLEATGLTVGMTRAGDETLTLSNRVARAAAWDADLFVSIHFNEAANPSARGSETFVLAAGGQPITASSELDGWPEAMPANRYDAANFLAGLAIQGQLLRATGHQDRGVRRSRFYVLREAVCPAVLVECAFMSHQEEAAQLADAAYLDRIAAGIADGIRLYVEWVRRAQQ
jgi:N-acetylmuramoyl-L-alanine amidase